MGAIQRFEYRFKHGLRFQQHLVIPKPQHPKPSFFDLPVSMAIVLRVVLMLSAIQFDDQFGFDAGEIGDIGTNRNLAPETMAADLPVAQKAPEVAFGVGCLVS